jgi:hypothetical protein
MRDKRHWRELCQQAAYQEAPDRLLDLVREINNQLEEKEKRLRSAQPWDTSEQTDNA